MPADDTPAIDAPFEDTRTPSPAWITFYGGPDADEILHVSISKDVALGRPFHPPVGWKQRDEETWVSPHGTTSIFPVHSPSLAFVRVWPENGEPWPYPLLGDLLRAHVNPRLGRTELMPREGEE